MANLRTHQNTLLPPIQMAFTRETQATIEESTFDWSGLFSRQIEASTRDSRVGEGERESFIVFVPQVRMSTWIGVHFFMKCRKSRQYFHSSSIGR